MSGWIVVAYIIGMFALVCFGYWRRSMGERRIDPHTGEQIRPASLPRPERWFVQSYVLCYTLYVLLLALTVVTAFVWVDAVRAILPLSPIDPDWHNLSFWLLMFAVWVWLIVLVAGGEIYMRNGIEQRQGLRRLAHIAAGLGAFLGLGALLQQLR